MLWDEKLYKKVVQLSRFGFYSIIIVQTIVSMFVCSHNFFQMERESYAKPCFLDNKNTTIDFLKIIELKLKL